ncbi:MAG: hypothetical protein QME68_01365 [Elusimicrobiota bacterium]|nr:hypothetical protein [Elusimicrobiota bacterium]
MAKKREKVIKIETSPALSEIALTSNFSFSISNCSTVRWEESNYRVSVIKSTA